MLKRWFGNQQQRDIAQDNNAFTLFDNFFTTLLNEEDVQAFDEQCAVLLDSCLMISNQYVEPAYQFNHNIAPYFNLPQVKRHVKSKMIAGTEMNVYQLMYDRQQVIWRETPNPASDAFETYMLGRLVEQDIEIRFDAQADDFGSDELADNETNTRIWFALPPAVWQKLENKYGTDLVRSHFQPLGDSFWIENYDYELI